MMHRAWSSIVEVPYCFSRSYVKFQGHTDLKIVKFDPNWAFPDSNSSLNSRMAMKCCTKLETTKERCPIVFGGHPSNFKVTRDKTSPILIQIWRFRTVGRSQLSNPSDLPCWKSNYKKLCHRNKRVDWHGTKRMWIHRMLNPSCGFKLWPHPWPWPWIFKVKFLIAIFLGMGRSLTWNKRDVSWIQCWMHNELALRPQANTLAK